MSYNDDVRGALGPGGFSFDSLQRITRLSFEFIDNIDNGQAVHPIVPFVIAMVCSQIADGWEDEPVDADAARLVETHVGPKLLALLDASTHELTGRLDDLVRACVDTRGLP
jgi:hypothetical protein